MKIIRFILLVIKGVTTDNRLSQLEYTTRSLNHKHAYKHGLMKAKGSDNGQAILNDEQVLAIRILFESGETRKNIAAKLNLKYQTVSDIVARRRWAHI